MASLEACWCANLVDSLGGTPETCCRVAGTPIIAECCGGFAWVRLISAYPSKIFPQRQGEAERCLIDTWAVTVEIGVARCAPTTSGPTDNPCCAQEAAAAAILDDDFFRMRATLTCCLALRHDEILLGDYAIQGPSGTCLSSTMRATLFTQL